jgi:hypothetical protein
VQLVHDWYEPIDRTIEIFAGDASSAETIDVDFEREGKLRAGKTRPPDEPEENDGAAPAPIDIAPEPADAAEAPAPEPRVTPPSTPKRAPARKTTKKRRGR